MKTISAKLSELIKAHETIVFFATFLIALGICVAACYFFKPDHPLYTIIISIGASIIATQIVSYVYRLYCGGDIERIITENLEIMQKNFPVLKSCNIYGLFEIADERFPLKEDSYKIDFLNSKKVIIVMNDAKNFLSDNNLLLQKRFEATDKEAIFILLDYDKQWLMSALAQRNGHGDDEKYYVRKIQTVIKQIEKLNSEAKKHKHSLRLFLYYSFNTLAMVLTDNYVMESTYRLTCEKTSVPHFIFRKGGNEYKYAALDISGKLFSKNEDGTYKYIREIQI